MICPKCETSTNPLGFAKNIPANKQIHGCPKCGSVYRDDGKEFNIPLSNLAVGTGLSGGVQSAMDKVFKEGGRTLSSSEAAVIQAIISDLYIQGFSSGVKQGLLLGTIQTRYKEAAEKNVEGSKI